MEIKRRGIEKRHILVKWTVSLYKHKYKYINNVFALLWYETNFLRNVQTVVLNYLAFSFN